jgi:hypothetical protein
MKVLLLYLHTSSAMGHQDEKELIGTFVGETEDECKKKVQDKYNKTFDEVIRGWCSYKIMNAL